jgi:hypothetical protein
MTFSLKLARILRRGHRQARSVPSRSRAAAALALVTAIAATASSASAAELALCDQCNLLVGAGVTYRYFEHAGGVVIPITWVLDDNRYELGAFRFANTQVFLSTHENVYDSVPPYWAASFTRRWRLLGGSWGRVYLGLGASYKNQTDALNSTHWNFAPQLGVRFNLGTSGAIMELTIRHWSNAGLKFPNRGQDFATLSFGF